MAGACALHIPAPSTATGTCSKGFGDGADSGSTQAGEAGRGHSFHLTSDLLSRRGSSSRRWQHTGRQPAWGQTGPGSTAAGSRSPGAGAMAALLPVVQGHEVEVCDLHWWPDLGREGDGGEGGPAGTPSPCPPLPRHSGRPTGSPRGGGQGCRGAQPGHRSRGHSQHGTGTRTGRGADPTSTYAVVGQQGVHVVLGEKGGREHTVQHRCHPAAPGAQPCHTATHGPGRGSCLHSPREAPALAGAVQEHLQRDACDPR